jgi:uncharacterized protein involved in exopolysaccharide biosynthesis
MNGNPLGYGALTILFKHQRAVLGVFLAVVFLGFSYLMLAQQKYKSEAELVVRFGNRSIGDISQAPQTQLTPADRREIVLSHAEILKSPDIARATIEGVGTSIVYPDIVENPPGRWSVMDEAIRRFAENLWVSVGTQNNVITVSFLHPDKAVAQKVVQKLVNLYIDQQTVVYHDPHSNFLSTEVVDAGKRLTKAQSALEEFKLKWNINDYDGEITELLKRRGDVDASLHQAEAALVQAQHRQVDLEHLMKDVPRTVPESAGGEKYRSLDDAQVRLAELKNKESQMLATYSPNSPTMVTLRAGIAAAEAELKNRQAELSRRSSSNVNTVYQTMQTDYLRTVADAKANAEPVRILTEQKADIDKRLSDLRENRAKFSDLSREQSLAEEVYRSLSTQYEDARVKDSLNQKNISSVAVISQPSLPYKTSRPRRLVTLLVTLFAGSILAMGVALILEAKDNRFTTSEQLSYFLDLPVLASFEHRRRGLPGLLPAHGEA